MEWHEEYKRAAGDTTWIIAKCISPWEKEGLYGPNLTSSVIRRFHFAAIIIINLFQEDSLLIPFCGNNNNNKNNFISSLTCSPQLHWLLNKHIRYYLQYVQSRWSLRTPCMLRAGNPTLLTWRGGGGYYDLCRLKISRWLPHEVQE